MEEKNNDNRWCLVLILALTGGMLCKRFLLAGFSPFQALLFTILIQMGVVLISVLIYIVYMNSKRD